MSFLIQVTSCTPNSSGVGKTLTTIGLNQALNIIGERSIANIREPSIGPVFGRKGGATGGGSASLADPTNVNLHFSGDIHAVSSAHNLMVAAIRNFAYWNKDTENEVEEIFVRNVMDICDRTLRRQFDLPASSEIMLILSICQTRSELEERLGNILLGKTVSGKMLHVKDLELTSALYALVKDAFEPTLTACQYSYPVHVHTGCFGNIAHGNSSIVADNIGLNKYDFVCTESGFGTDLGFEKAVNIKAKYSNRLPDCVVLVVRCDTWDYQDFMFHYNNIKRTEIPCVVTINRFANDSDESVNSIIDTIWHSVGVECVPHTLFESAEGGIELAETVKDICEENSGMRNLVVHRKEILKSIDDALIFHGEGTIDMTTIFDEMGELQKYGHYTVCISKKPTDNNCDITCQGIKYYHGAEMVVLEFCDASVQLMPGMPEDANYINFV